MACIEREPCILEKRVVDRATASRNIVQKRQSTDWSACLAKHDYKELTTHRHATGDKAGHLLAGLLKAEQCKTAISAIANRMATVCTNRPI